jgi:hypothetical protein
VLLDQAANCFRHRQILFVFLSFHDRFRKIGTHFLAAIVLIDVIDTGGRQNESEKQLPTKMGSFRNRNDFASCGSSRQIYRLHLSIAAGQALA